MDTDRDKRAAELRAIRTELGITQKALGRFLGISRASIYRQESGRIGIAEPTLRLARWFAEAYRQGWRPNHDLSTRPVPRPRHRAAPQAPDEPAGQDPSASGTP